MGLKPRQRLILAALRGLGGRASTREIAAKTGLHANGVSQSLGVMDVWRLGTRDGATYWATQEWIKKHKDHTWELIGWVDFARGEILQTRPKGGGPATFRMRCKDCFLAQDVLDTDVCPACFAKMVIDDFTPGQGDRIYRHRCPQGHHESSCT